MKAPFVGPPSTAQDDRCAFAQDIDQPKCERPATVHLAVRSEGWGVVGLAACPDHELIARAAGAVLAEYAAGPLCGFLTGECWS